MKNIARFPIGTGLFYPNSARKLKENVLELLERVAPISPAGELVALVVPHGAYVSSGLVAAHAYRLLQSRPYDSLIVLGPNHQRAGFPGTSVYAKGSFKTPLGEMEVDAELAEDILANDSGAIFDLPAHSEEHSIEVQLPFLQTVLPSSKIVPIVMNDHSWKACERLADAMVKSIRRQSSKHILIIATTDLSQDRKYEDVVRMDKVAIQDIECMDPGRLHMDVVHGERSELCGFGPVLATLLATRKRGATYVKTLSYTNTGEMTGDEASVRGYVSMAISKRLNEDQELLEEIEEESLQFSISNF